MLSENRTEPKQTSYANNQHAETNPNELANHDPTPGMKGANDYSDERILSHYKV